MAAAAARRRSILFLSLATTKNQYFPKSSSIIGVRTATTSIFSSILANSSPFHHSSSIVTQDLRYTCRNCGSSRSTTTTGNFDWNPQRVTNFDSIVEEATDPVNFGRGDEKHWLIGYFFDGVDFASEQELFDFYVDTLALCFPTKEEARKRIYLVSCEHTFGFGAESDFPYLCGCPNISFVMEDACYGDRNKDLTEMSSSRASNEPVASAATTTSMKRKSDDMAWEWGECRDPNNKKFVWCTLCDKRMSGGINWLKEHLVHKKRNVMSCPKVTIEIQHKVNATLREVKKKKLDKSRVHGLLQRQDEDDDVVEEQNICSGGGNRNQGISIGRRKAIDNVRGPLDQLLTTDNMKQSTLDKNNPQKQVLKKKAWLCIAKWAYEVGLPFNAVRPPSFTKMIHAIGEYGRAMPPPSYHNLRVTLLKEVYAETKEFVNSFRPHWQLYGCSLMSDFWTDGKGRCLINFMVSCPKGTIFLKSIVALEEVKEAIYIVRMINEVIVEVGAENIVSFVTDNGSNYKLAGAMLEEEHGSMFWTPCATHCINLMLQDFGSGEKTALPKIKSALSEAKVVVVYLYNHGRVLAWLRKLTGGRELHRSCVTRFATQFYTLRSMWENRHHVQVLFVSEYWRNSDFAKKSDGKRVERIVAKESF